MNLKTPVKNDDPQTVKAMRLYGLEFGYDFIGAEGGTAKFKKPGVILMKISIAQAMQALKEQGYGY